MEYIDNFFAEFVNIAWGWQTAVLLLGAGVYFSLRTKLKPFRYLGYAFEVLMGNILVKMKWVKLVIFEHLQLASLEPLVLAILLVWLSLYSWVVLEPFFGCG